MTEKTAFNIYFFGVWHAGEAGHYLHIPTHYSRFAVAMPRDLPWPERDLDGGLTWNAGAWNERGGNRWRAPSGRQVQGEAALHHKNGFPEQSARQTPLKLMRSFNDGGRYADA